jgi:hypothetical protein
MPSRAKSSPLMITPSWPRSATSSDGPVSSVAAGAYQLAGDGFVAAAFGHRTSRVGDPQLHTHVLVANLARGSDGAWGALDGRLLYRELTTAGYLYQAVLRHQLTRRLGVAWEPVTRGSADIQGIPKPVLRGFSRRRTVIEAAMAEHNASPGRGAAVATLATRPPKDHHADFGVLQAEWRARAAVLGLDPSGLDRLVGIARPVPVAVDVSDLARAVTAQSATFDRRAVLRALAERASAGATIGVLETQVERLLASPRVVRLAGDRYTTHEMLRLEATILSSARARLAAHAGVVPAEVVDRELRARGLLSAEQTRMVRHLTRSGRGVDVVIGVAGAGKTAALAGAHAAWQRAGHTTVGVALAARAAAELHQHTGMPTSTLAAFLQDLDQPGHDTPANAVIVVDEAGMVGTRQLARLLAHANKADAKVVLVGDDRQLPAIEAGGAVAALARQLPTVRLGENRRQRDPIERRALAELRAGHARQAIARLAAHHRITICDTPVRAREQLINDWMTARQTGEDVLMLASRRRDVDALNQLARHRLAVAGELPPGGITLAEHNFTIGDRVMTLHNQRRLGVTNGARGTIDAIAPDGVAVRFDDGRHVSLPDAYTQSGHLTHAYAITIHKAQGLTCDRALVLANAGITREAGYTALSRGRNENRLYAVTCEPTHLDVGHGINQADRGDALHGLVTSLETTRRKQLALDTPPISPARTAAAIEPPDLSIGLEL